MQTTRSGDGVAIAWHETGSGPPVVLLHSLGTTSQMWAPVADTLSDRYRVISVDLRGHGDSGAPPGPYTLDMLGADLMAVVAAAELATFDLVGISLGGQIALWTAIHHPGRLRSVVMSNTAARIGSRERWQDRVATVHDLGLAHVSRAVTTAWFSDGFADRQPEQWEAARQMLESTIPEGYIGSCEALAEADLRGSVTAVSVPTLIITAEMDQSTPPTDAEWLHLHIPGSRLETVPGCAHLPPLEKPDEYAALLGEWLDALPTPAQPGV